MKLSKETRIAYMACGLIRSLDLVTVKDIAGMLGVSYHTTSKVCKKMKKSGYLKAKPGPRGGYSIKRKMVTLFELNELFSPLPDVGDSFSVIYHEFNRIMKQYSI